MDLSAFLRVHPVPHGATLLVAVSGGADSLALMVMLAEARAAHGFTVRAAHLHHGMRAAADADVEMLRGICEALDLPLDAGYADVPAIAEERRLSLEVAGREARYAFLYGTAAAHGAYGICTGHTRDDQAETVLLRVIAGTGLDGLAGIFPARHVTPPESPSPVWLLRPLLSTSRAETEAFCAERGYTPVQDPYNEDPAYPRNRIRRDLLPLLERDYNPAVKEALARLADIVREDNAILETQVARAAPVERHASAPAISRAALLTLPPALQRRAARNLLRAAGGGPALRFSNVERLLEAASTGRRAQLRGRLTAECEGNLMWLVPTPPMEAGGNRSAE